MTQQAVAANAAAIAEHGLGVTARDRCVSWLPLYHDMGLVGCCLTPIMAQISIDYIPTTGFARRPLTWLKVMSEQRGTISFAPTFGYDLCVRRAKGNGLETYDLSAWRVAGIGGEMIRVRALQEFADCFAASGFRREAFVPSYGLAEATLAVTFSTPGEGVDVDWVRCGAALERDRQAIAAEPGSDGAREHARPFAVCGRPMPGYRVEIRDERNHRLRDRAIGRVCIRGPSLMRGYFRNLQATRSVVTADGWLDTGDMGYLVDGRLVITGRSKDLIIFNGRNIWPQDLEWAIEHLEGVRAGDVAAFAVTEDDGQERVVVVVECRASDPARRRELRHAVKATVQKVASVETEVVLAPPGSLTFTTSGKLSRVRRPLLQGKKDLGVLDAVAKAAGWDKPAPKGVHRGIAVVDSYGSFTAAVVELSVEGGNVIDVKRVIVAIDSGHIVHPDAVKAQMEGGVIWGLSSVMHEEITIENGRVVQSNFADYPVLRLAETPPKIETIIMPTGGFWGGVGEPPIGGVIPALANALFAATGKRVRSMPLKNHGFSV